MDTREDRLLELVGTVYESVLDPAMTAMALDRFASFFGGVAAQLYTFDQASGEVVDSQITDTLAAKDNEAYLAYYGRIDPRRQWLAETPVGIALRCSDRFDEKYVASSEFYQDFMRPAGMRWVMGCRFEAGPGSSSVLAAIRPTGTPTFDVHALDDLARVSAHFRRAALLRARLARAAVRASGAEALLDALCGPALLTDGRGAVLLANASALSAFGEIGTLLRGRYLRWHSAVNQMAWSRGLAGLLAGAPSRAVALEAGGAGWSVTLLRLRPLGVRLDGIGEQLTLALFEHVAAPPPRATAAGDAGEPLTPAETAILAGLLAGQSAKQLARERAVAVSTVRSQIATVLAKTRAHSQRELMARFAKR